MSIESSMSKMGLMDGADPVGKASSNGKIPTLGDVKKSARVCGPFHVYHEDYFSSVFHSLWSRGSSGFARAWSRFLVRSSSLVAGPYSWRELTYDLISDRRFATFKI